MASTSAGWQCPIEVTPQPAVRSMYSRPATSHTREPRPWARATGSRRTTGRKCRASRAWIASRSMTGALCIGCLHPALHEALGAVALLESELAVQAVRVARVQHPDPQSL